MADLELPLVVIARLQIPGVGNAFAVLARPRQLLDAACDVAPSLRDRLGETDRRSSDVGAAARVLVDRVVGERRPGAIVEDELHRADRVARVGAGDHHAGLHLGDRALRLDCHDASVAPGIDGDLAGGERVRIARRDQCRPSRCRRFRCAGHQVTPFLLLAFVAEVSAMSRAVFRAAKHRGRVRHKGPRVTRQDAPLGVAVAERLDVRRDIAQDVRRRGFGVRDHRLVRYRLRLWFLPRGSGNVVDRRPLDVETVRAREQAIAAELRRERDRHPGASLEVTNSTRLAADKVRLARQDEARRDFRLEALLNDNRFDRWCDGVVIDAGHPPPGRSRHPCCACCRGARRIGCRRRRPGRPACRGWRRARRCAVAACRSSL